jgi:hypothetical protein
MAMPSSARVSTGSSVRDASSMPPWTPRSTIAAVAASATKNSAVDAHDRENAAKSGSAPTAMMPACPTVQPATTV